MLLTEFNQEQYERTIRQEGWEEGWKEGWKEGWEEGLKEGIEDAHNCLSALYLSLLEEGRTDDLERAMKDNDFRAQLFQSYNL